MKGQNQGRTSPLRIAIDRLGWHLSDVVAAVNSISERAGDGPTSLSENHIGKWVRGDRTIGTRYAALLSVALDTEPAALGISTHPTLTRAISDLRARLVKRQQFENRTRLLSPQVATEAPSHWGRLDHLLPGRESTAIDDLVRIATSYADQLDTVSPANLMPQVHSLLARTSELLREGQSRRLAEVACNTAIVAGWLSYNVHNRGDALTLWTRAKELAAAVDSAQLRAYALGCLSCIFSGVPKRGEAWNDTNIPISMLDEAINISKGVTSPSLRAWLYSRRGEEHAAVGARRLAYQDIDRAYSALGRQIPTGVDNHVPILRPWREARLARYHGSAAQLVNDHRDAIRILSVAVERLEPSFLPQRAMAMTDLATVLAKMANPEPEKAASMLREAVDLAELAGLTEARMRVMDARRYLQLWKNEVFVQELDARIRLL